MDLSFADSTFGNFTIHAPILDMLVENNAKKVYQTAREYRYAMMIAFGGYRASYKPKVYKRGKYESNMENMFRDPVFDTQFEPTGKFSGDRAIRRIARITAAVPFTRYAFAHQWGVPHQWVFLPLLLNYGWDNGKRLRYHWDYFEGAHFMEEANDAIRDSGLQFNFGQMNARLANRVRKVTNRLW
jgi:hypothetical protein